MTVTDHVCSMVCTYIISWGLANWLYNPIIYGQPSDGEQQSDYPCDNHMVFISSETLSSTLLL